MVRRSINSNIGFAGAAFGRYDPHTVLTARIHWQASRADAKTQAQPDSLSWCTGVQYQTQLIRRACNKKADCTPDMRTTVNRAKLIVFWRTWITAVTPTVEPVSG